ncbi:phosphate starvation-inducible protein PhoH, partial [Escherichia coli]|nr:phosphate starvation-inducible protein PhoH [Escherichia coli]
SRLHNVKGISILKLDQSDVVRHPLVSKIIEHYEGEN